ncbi:heme/hemin ABC transporter substrate-binding protein [Providencia rettgeri]|uniref:heme/hemin ABC transporter substrate-binding protein n=1 Tax=Providencia rettgeri TaxID=587 RepID=UPI0023AA44C7|nr:ABC transporter substrate-binding protein [Providencia rettgeri]
MQYWLLVIITLCVSNNAMSKERIVSLGNDITEIIFALNFGDNIIAQSTLGSLAQISPTIEDIKRIDPQRIVSMRPTLVLASDQARHSSALLHIQNQGIHVIKVARGMTLEAIPNKIRIIAKQINQVHLGEQLIQSFQDDLSKIKISPINKNILFISNKGGALPLIAGTNTTADKLITAIGAKNAMANVALYQPLSPEAVIEGRPDLIVVSHESAKTLGGAKSIWRLPGMSMTPAGKNKSLVIVDETGMLHFGLSTPQVMAQIRQALEKLPE